MKDRFKILILSDSLAAPRSVDGKTLLTYEQSWPCILRDALPQARVLQTSFGSSTIRDLLQQSVYWKPFQADVTIVQAGLNDCLPRALHRFELSLCDKFPTLGRRIHMLIGRNPAYYRKMRNIRYTRLSEFRKTAVAFSHALPNVKWLGIVHDKTSTVSRFPGVERHIKRYNDVLQDVYRDRFINLEYVEHGMIMEDQFHVNAEGHVYVASLLLRLLNEKYGLEVCMENRGGRRYPYLLERRASAGGVV